MTELNYIGFDFLEVAILILLPSFVGSLASDYVKTLQGTYLKVRIGRVVASGAFSSFVGISTLYKYLINMESANLLMLACFLLGMIAFEVIQYLATLDGWLTLIVKLKAIVVPLFQMLNAFNQFRKSYSDVREDTSAASDVIESIKINDPKEKTSISLASANTPKTSNTTTVKSGGKSHDI